MMDNHEDLNSILTLVMASSYVYRDGFVVEPLGFKSPRHKIASCLMSFNLENQIVPLVFISKV